MTIYTLIGLAGAAGYVISYVLLQLKKIDGNGVLYTALNIVAALLVLISLLEKFNLAAVVIQVMWVGFGVIGLGLRARNQNDADGASTVPSNVVVRADAATPGLVAPGIIEYSTLPAMYEHNLHELEHHVAELRASNPLAGA